MLYNRYLLVSFPSSGVEVGGRHEFINGVIRYPLDVEFSVTMNTDSGPNEASVTIFNLSPESQQELLVEGSPITIEAGYWPQNGPRDTAILFSGQIRKSKTTREGAVDVKTTIECGDGDDAYAHSRIRKVMSKPTSEQIVDEAVAAMGEFGIERGIIRVPAFTEKRDRTIDRAARRELTDIAYAQDLAWHIQDGKLNVYPRDEPMLETGLLLGPDNGVIESPEFHDKGINMKTLMLPSIRPGMTFSLENKVASLGPRTSSACKIDTLTFSGGLTSGFFGASIQATYVKEAKVERRRESLIGGVT